MLDIVPIVEVGKVLIVTATIGTVVAMLLAPIVRIFFD